MPSMKNWIAKLQNIRWLSSFLCFFSFLFLDFSFRYIYSFAGSTDVWDAQPVNFTIGWALLFTGLLLFLPRLLRRIAMMVLILFFTLLALVHAAMYNIFGSFFTFSDLNFAGDGAKFFSWSYLSFRKLFLICLVVTVLIMVLAVLCVPKKQPGVHPWKRCLIAAVLCLLSLYPLIKTHRDSLPQEDTMWWGSTYDPASSEEIYKNFTDSNRALTMTGLYQYTFRNFVVSFGLEGSDVDLDELDAFYEERAQEISGDNEMTGAFEGKNLIMVMMESIDTWMITPEYMPNLYALQQESINFSNHYTPLFLSAGTFNTEITSQTGLIPSSTGVNNSSYSTNAFPLSLANLFEEKGYTANSFHSANPFIYSRGSIHVNLGFEAYHNYEDMGMDDYMLDSQLIRAYDQMVLDDENFFSYIITYSGHGPYTQEMSNISDPHLQAAQEAVAASGITGSEANMTEYTLAIAHAMETDAFIGELIQQLQADGHLEDTVLLFYSDHYGKYMTDLDFLKEVKGVGDSETELYHTPCFLYSADQEPLTVEKCTSTVDLLPTLVNLFALDADRRYYVGDDIFGDKGGIVMFPNYSWYDGEIYYSADYDGEMTDYITEVSLEVKERLDASFDTLKGNYFAYRTIN